ncbi:MAG: tyrosine-type recombinase/integrase [Archangiaceae bacterium]|nr:tyrosine-type recombinase/integrase [Archangiaceae bacterium]
MLGAWLRLDGEAERVRRKDVAEGLSQVHIPGTKTKYRDRMVPIFAPWQRSLLERAMEHASGRDGMLFAPWSNVRRDIYAACKRANIEMCSPNDLRRTNASWLRAEGVPAEIIGQAVMGHREGRMVELVYGRMTT